MKILITLMTLSLGLLACFNTNQYIDGDLTHDIQNQGDMHTCYAHSLSALYSFEKNVNVNPYWLAFIHKDRLLHWNPRNLNFSLLSWAYSDFKKKGLCNADDLKDHLFQLKSGTKYSDDQYFYFLQAYFLKENNPQKLIKFLKKESKDFEVSWSYQDVKSLVSKIKSSGKEKLFDYLRNVVFKSCENNEKVYGDISSTGRGFQSNDKLLKNVLSVLNQDKIVSIGLCPDGAYKKLDEDSSVNIKPRILKSAIPKCGAHYVNIVGSREGKKSCELLIRNSYPGFWAHKNYECFCEMKDGSKANCKRDDISVEKVLGCWIPSDKVLTNTYDISFME